MHQNTKWKVYSYVKTYLAVNQILIVENSPLQMST